MKRINTCFLSLLVCTFSYFGCDSEGDNSHDVTVAWEMSGMQSCQSPTLPDGQTLEFEEIHIEVFEEEDPEADPILFFDVPCDDFAYTIQNLEEGDYFVTLGAIAEYDGEVLPFFQASGDIEAPAEDGEVYTMQLMLGTGSVQVSWSFEGMMCGPAGVETVNIYLEGDLANNDYNYENVTCNDGLLLIEDVKWDTYSLAVDGFDAEGSKTHSGEVEDFEVKPGELVTSDAFVELLEI